MPAMTKTAYFNGTSLTKANIYSRCACYSQMLFTTLEGTSRHECAYFLNIYVLEHGLSQQGVWVSLLTPKPLEKNNPQDTQFFS